MMSLSMGGMAFEAVVDLEAFALGTQIPNRR